MRIIIDTNVLVSGVFFGGPPYDILEAWRDGKLILLISPAIFEEYNRVMEELASNFPEIQIESLLNYLVVHSELVLPPPLDPVIHDDPSDDKFLECGVAGKAAYIVTGDKHLLKLRTFGEIPIVNPRTFLQKYHLKG